MPDHGHSSKEKKYIFFVIFVTGLLTEPRISRCSLVPRVRSACATRRRFTAWITPVEAFLKARKANAKTAKTARTCLGRRATNAVSEARHERSVNCFLTLFPSIRECAHGKKSALPPLYSLALFLFFFNYYIFPWTMYVTTEYSAFLSHGYLTYVSNVRINTNGLRLPLTLLNYQISKYNGIFEVFNRKVSRL